MRAIRLVIGIAILIQGIISREIMTMVLGGIFSGLALANVGCCGATTCSITRATGSTRKIQYEELDN